MTAAVITSVQCNRCPRRIPLAGMGRWGNPADGSFGNLRDGYMCPACFQEHLSARDRLQARLASHHDKHVGDAPIDFLMWRCEGPCGRTTEQIFAATGRTDAYIQFIDGELARLCPGCSDAYSRKATKLYAGTQYESVKKLRGSK